jgi:hypothetical protein
LTFTLGAGALTATPAAAIREQTAERGSLTLMSSYDGDQHRPFDYGSMRKATHAEFMRLATVDLTRVPGGPVLLPPGSYEARTWFAGGFARQGEVLVSSSPHAIFGRREGALPNPAVVPFELPVSVGRVAVNVADKTLASSVVRIEIAPLSIVPRHRRENVPVRAIESIPGRPGGYIVYTDEHAFPEGGVFWTRGTEAATVLLAPARASRARLTLHLGPLAGEVKISIAGEDHVVQVPAGALEFFEADLPSNLRLVPLTIQSTTTFRPSETDSSSHDMRRLGCQVRVELQ